MGQAAVIKINSRDFFSLRQGHALPGREEEKEKQREVGLHGWAEPNSEICKEVRCHLILINLHLGGLAPPHCTGVCVCVCGGGGGCLSHGGLFCPCRSLLFTECSSLNPGSPKNYIHVQLGGVLSFFFHFFVLRYNP